MTNLSSLSYSVGCSSIAAATTTSASAIKQHLTSAYDSVVVTGFDNESSPASPASSVDDMNENVTSLIHTANHSPVHVQTTKEHVCLDPHPPVVSPTIIDSSEIASKSLQWISKDDQVSSSIPTTHQSDDVDTRRRRKSLPQRAPPSTVATTNESPSDSAAVVFKFVLDPRSGSTKIQLTARPEGFVAMCMRRRRYARLLNDDSALTSTYPYAIRRRRKYSDVPPMRTDNHDEDHFASSELFYSAFVDDSDARFNNNNICNHSDASSLKRKNSVVEYDLPCYGDEDFDDYDDDLLTPPLTPPAKKKKKTVKRPRTNKTVKTHAEKFCWSCKTNQTPIWREVKEPWGEGWEDVLLCNACGLQWRMAGLRCSECNYVPRASEKRQKNCTRCDNGFWYRKG